MRFTIAAAILAQALPALSQEDASVVTTLEVSPLMIQEDKKKDAVQKVMSASHRGNKKGVKGNRPTMNHFAKNAKKNMANVGIECNPDIGVLSCGMGLYCKANDNSSLGGSCAPVANGGRRKLEQTGNFTSPGLGNEYCVTYADDYDCDCSAWDADTSTGDVSCNLESESCAVICPNICYETTGAYSSDGALFEYTSCTDFTAPFEQHFCFTGAADGTCKITLDGVECTSCEVLTECGSFDCENVGMGSGSFCESDPIAPIWYSCDYTPPTSTDAPGTGSAPYDPCTLCPYGVAYPDSTLQGLDGSVYTCNELSASALLGYVNAQECAIASLAAQSTCCFESTEVFKCNICGVDGMYITLPEATVYMPSAGTYSCGDLYYGAQLGQIPEQFCGFVPTLVAEPCGCEVGSKPTSVTVDTTPTSSPTATVTSDARPTTDPHATSKLALSAVACAAALVAL